MTTHVPRGPYSREELEKLYPKGLELQLVQILLRHGERSPVSARFQNAGLAPYWPYCSAAKRISSVVMSTKSGDWNELQWRRRLERFGDDDGPVISQGPGSEVDGICQLGELTDEGRGTTLALGQRLRHLYVDQLRYMPRLIADADMIYLRATPMPRALESVQQAFWGLYPLSTRTATFPPPTIITRTPADETLFPNDSNCRRFNQLSRAFAQRTADRWNKTDEMAYINKLISKWMPDDSPTVAVDSHPRLSGIMDTINSTLAHGPETRLPKEFYDPKLRKYVETIGVEEWFSGYQQSREYRMLGIGGLMGDIVSRMTGSVERRGHDGVLEVGGEPGQLGIGRGGEENIKLAMSGCHDTTLAAILSSLGAFKGELWPPYTSHIALEMFRKTDVQPLAPSGLINQVQDPSQTSETQALSSNKEDKKPGILSSLFGKSESSKPSITKTPPPSSTDSASIGRKPLSSLSEADRAKLNGYYVRIRYNDRVVSVPGCAAPGKHLDGDESFCTLEAFKEIVDKYVPVSWKGACASNMGEDAFKGVGNEEAGF